VLDIGFWELIVIAVVTLLVVGPERLPEVARKAGFYAGKIRRFIQSVKTELAEEIDADSLKKPFDDAKAPLHEIIEKYGVSIDIDRDDAIRLVDNIISNAIKYNRVGATLDITLTTKVLKVKDSGIGIEERDLHQIFDRFRRANKSEGGFGIGLNIVYQLTQLYGFDIDIVSEPNIGTEVIIKWQK